jgi:hypothetical protein
MRTVGCQSQTEAGLNELTLKSQVSSASAIIFFANYTLIIII